MLELHAESHTHGLDNNTLDFILDIFKDKNEFFKETIECSQSFDCALYGPIMGDEPITEDQVYYADRGEGRGKSRMVRKPFRQTNLLTVIGGPHEDKSCILYTAFGGPLAAKEPTDSSLSNDEMQESKSFWDVHALADGTSIDKSGAYQPNNYYEFNSLYDLVKTAAAESASQLKERLKNIFTENQFNALLSTDPTYTGGDKIGSYTLWLIKQFKSNPGSLESDFSNYIYKHLKKFDEIKHNLGQDYKRIESYSTYNDLIDYVGEFVRDDENAAAQIEEDKKYAEILYSDDTWDVVTPTSFEGSCAWGYGTEWCTAKTRNDSAYNDYVKDGRLYIFVNKVTGDKYQYSSSKEEFRDGEENSLELGSFMLTVKDRYPDFYSFLINGFSSQVAADMELSAEEQFEKEQQYRDNTFDLFFVDEVNDNIKIITEYLSEFLPEDFEFTVNGLPTTLYKLIAEITFTSILDGESALPYDGSLWVNWEKVLPKVLDQYSNMVANTKQYREKENGQQFINFDEQIYASIISLDDLVKLAKLKSRVIHVEEISKIVSGLTDSEIVMYDWDKVAFGFSNGEIINLPIDEINIKYTDMNNVIGFSMEKYFKSIPYEDLPPIKISLENGEFWIEDGHHRYGYALELNKGTVPVMVSIKDNPFDYLGVQMDDIFKIRNEMCR